MNTRYHFKETEDSICITGYEGMARILDLPEELNGKPVRAVGSRAFAGMDSLQALYLGKTIREIGSFAFYNCRNLRYLSLWNGIQAFGHGALRQCSALQEMELHLLSEDYSLLRMVLDCVESSLSVLLHDSKGETSRLVFPWYLLESKEDFEARAIHVSIEGAGYTYREAVRKNGVDFAAYDNAFGRLCSADPMLAVEAALARLAYPYCLSPGHQKRYQAFLQEHRVSALDRCLGDGENKERKTKIQILLKNVSYQPVEIQTAANLASRNGEAELCALLMAELGGSGSKKQAAAFSL